MEGKVTEPVCLEVKALESSWYFCGRFCLHFMAKQTEYKISPLGGLCICLTPWLCLQW